MSEEIPIRLDCAASGDKLQDCNQVQVHVLWLSLYAGTNGPIAYL